MRAQTDVPEWALDAVRKRLRAGEEIINALTFKARLTDVVICNTSRGAAVVAKPLLGRAESALLAYPKDLLTFRCRACNDRNVLVDVRAPVDVYCAHCGKAQHVVGGGKTGAPKEAAKRRPSKAPAQATGHQIAARRAVRRAPAKRAAPKTAPSQTSQGTRKPRAKPTAAKRGKSPSTTTYKPQCEAITPRNAQCRNSARGTSKYCGAHKGYRPPLRARAARARDTFPKVRGAKDTVPSSRKGAVRRRKRVST